MFHMFWFHFFFYNLDPYFNIDARTISPFEYKEVYVWDDCEVQELHFLFYFFVKFTI